MTWGRINYLSLFFSPPLLLQSRIPEYLGEVLALMVLVKSGSPNETRLDGAQEVGSWRWVGTVSIGSLHRPLSQFPFNSVPTLHGRTGVLMVINSVEQCILGMTRPDLSGDSDGGSPTTLQAVTFSLQSTLLVCLKKQQSYCCLTRRDYVIGPVYLGWQSSYFVILPNASRKRMFVFSYHF